MPRRTAQPPPSHRRLGLASACIVAGASYSWWATGLRSFTTLSTVAVAIPVALVIAGMLVGAGRPMTTGAETPGPNSGLSGAELGPWIALLVLACGLEIAGLALGGHSRTVPTLSTVVDQTLAWHLSRFALFAAWLAWGGAPLLRTAAAWISHPTPDAEP